MIKWIQMGYTQVSDGFCKKWFLIDFPIELAGFFFSHSQTQSSFNHRSR
jgi:hypothetical protein